MKNRPRLSLAVALSVGAHAAALAVALGSSLIGAWPAAPVEIEITGTKAEDVTDLPLGSAAAPPPPAPPPPAAVAEPGPPPPRRREPKPRPAEETATPEESTPVAPPRPQSVRSYGPAGSRVTALLRLDRLRGTPYASSVDALLLRLPDRRDLLEGTSLDLYRDLDALLVATPNPLDPAVTFLAVRHRLTDGALREALERGAHATGRTLKWRTERGRPFAERLPAAGQEGGPGWRRRDERLILLAAPKLAVVTPPAYRSLILRGGAAVRPARAGKDDRAGQGGAGAGAASETSAAVGAGGASGADQAAAGPARDEHADWAALVRRIDAEDSIMPRDAVVMFSAEDIFGPPSAGDDRRRPATAKFRPGTQKSWRRPIFPKGCPLSIFGAGELDFRVRDGNGYGLSASVTRIRCVWMLFGCDHRQARRPAWAPFSAIDLRNQSSRRGTIHDSQPLTPGQLLKRSSPRPLVPLSFIRHRTSTCGLSNRWSPCGLTRLTRWGTSSRGELRT